MILNLFKDINTILTPIIGVATLVNSFILIWAYIRSNIYNQNELYYAKITDNKVYFYNRGNNSIKISKLSIAYLNGDVVETYKEIEYENPIFVDAHKNWIFEINIPHITFGETDYKNIYLCFDLKSDTGLIYEFLCCPIYKRHKKMIVRTQKLKKELYLLQQNQ